MQRKNGRLQPGNCNIWRALIRQFPIVGQDPIRTTRGANGFGECDGACVTWLERGIEVQKQSITKIMISGPLWTEHGNIFAKPSDQTGGPRPRKASVERSWS